jgi:large subunit ribosomal protein L23
MVLKGLIPQGPKVWLPNFVLTMVRSGRESKPNEVVFRVPRVLNRLDIKQYLEGLYGVTVQSVATFNFLGKTTRNGRRRIPSRKNAIVTLNEPFQYPPPTDMSLLKYPLPPGNIYPRVH